MYSIALKENQYATYILSDQAAGAHLEVVPERGGIITQWRLQTTDLLYLDAERFKDPNLSVRGGIPILFPICGNLPEDTYSVNGQTYQLPQHGFARNLPWRVSDRGVVADPAEGTANSEARSGAMLQLTLESNADTLSRYPFEFELQFTYWLKGNQLILDQRFTNLSEQPMPFSTGLHPYFQVGASLADKSQLKVDIPAAAYSDRITQSEHPYSGTLDWPKFDQVGEIDVAFRPVSAQQASVSDPQRNVTLSVTYDEPYRTLVFWTVAGKDFYCIEPWSAPRNALNTGTDLITLAPGTSQTLSTTFTALVGA
jgi:galactose mutarotase-like enzyme